MEDGNDPSSAFLDALRTRAMDEMHEAALEYGIILKDLGKTGCSTLSKLSLTPVIAVIDRQFKGEIGMLLFAWVAVNR